MVIVNPRVENTVSPDLLAELLKIAPATIGHLLEHEFMDGELRPVISRFKFAGPAITVRCFGQDSAIVHYAVDVAQPGDVIVIDRLGDKKHACWGGGVTNGAIARGVVGAVVDGAITDQVEITDFKFPVFGRYISPVTTRAPGVTGELNVPVKCGGVMVNPGDIILADDDGIIVLPPGRIAEIVKTCLPIEERAPARWKQVREGTPLGVLSGAHARIDATLAREREAASGH